MSAESIGYRCSKVYIWFHLIIIIKSEVSTFFRRCHTFRRFVRYCCILSIALYPPTRQMFCFPLQWRHKAGEDIPKHRCLDCLFNRLFRRRSLKHQSSASLAKRPVTGKIDDAIMHDYDYEKSAAEFIKKYDDNSSPPIYNKLEYDCLNSNFTKLEIEAAIDYLKYDKAPGADYVPAEFIKSCKSVIADDITDVFNYIIEKKEFPDLWTEGIRSAAHKGGTEKLVDNYRGITILPIMDLISSYYHNQIGSINLFPSLPYVP